MRALPIIRSQDMRYTRDSEFSYECHACSRCCYDKVIQLNPYEVARLARNRGISTTEVLARYAERSGTALRRTEQGACVFLTPEGCGVHPDRPLVCRLYPLGRHVTGERGEEFRELQPHPETEGEYGTAWTVQAFLDRQGADPFIKVADAYAELVGRLANALHERVRDREQFSEDMQAALDGAREEGQGRHVSDWLDLDRIVEHDCAERGVPVPIDMMDKMLIHLRAVESWLLAHPILQKEERHESR